MRNPEPKSSERGNILFYILIAITLLAALIYAVAQSGRGSVQQVSEERSKLLASEIMDYANAVGTAFAQLRLRGCKIEQVSFEASGNTGYANPDAPVDKTCHVFELAGGGVTFKKPPSEAVENGAAYHIVSGEIEINQVGSTCGGNACVDLVLFTGELQKAVCVQINNKLGVGTPDTDPPEVAGDTASTSPYQGAGGFGYEETVGEEMTGTAITGKTAGCYEDGGKYFFYKVLATR